MNKETDYSIKGKKKQRTQGYKTKCERRCAMHKSKLKEDVLVRFGIYDCWDTFIRKNQINEN